MIGVDQGEVILFSDFEENGEMWAGSGPRQRVAKVNFSSEFKSPPAVHVGLSMWDMDSETNPRVDIKARKITTSGFEVQFKTWNDTRIARVRASWMAIGAIGTGDAWDEV